MFLFLVISCQDWTPCSDRVRVGMTKAQVEELCGEPWQKHQSFHVGMGEMEIWTWCHGRHPRFKTNSVTFKNGIAVGMSKNE